MQDIKFALRSLRKTPVFTAVAILSLTLAIGANTAIFGLLNALVWRELPVRDPQSLVQISVSTPGASYHPGLTFPMFEELGRRQQVFSALFGWLGTSVLNIETDREQTRGAIGAVTGNFYSELGIRPVAGRLIGPSDIDPATLEPARVAVIGFAFWQRQFGGSAAALGQRVRVEDEPFTIVGVAPQAFTGLGLVVEPDVTIPFRAYSIVSKRPVAALRTSGSFTVQTTGRLKPGVTLDQARAALDTLWPALKADTVPATFTPAQRDRFLAAPLLVASAAYGVEPGLRRRFTQPLIIVFGIAAVVLGIACVNLASLMLSRSAARAHELGVRLALGAGRWRVARQLLVEGLLLSAAGAAAGVGFAYWSSHAFVGLMLQDYSIRATLNVAPDVRMLGFASATAILAGALFSVAPAWRASRLQSIELLQQSTRTVSGTGRTGRILVAAQIALSLILVTSAGLLVRTLQQIRSVDSGMRAEQVFVAYPGPRPGGYGRIDNDVYYPNLVERIKTLPGVQQAAIALSKPAGGDNSGGERVAAIDAPAEAAGVASQLMSISPGLFDTLTIPLRAGRDFTWNDNSRDRPVAIVSESLASRLAPRGNVLGRHIRVGVLPRRQDLEIVGVVANAHVYDLKNPNLSAVYVPALQEGDLANGKCFVIRGSGVSAAELNRVVGALGYEYVGKAETLTYITDRVLLQERVTAILAAFFGALALLLASIGLYGLMSYAVSQRVREIGIRMALGADARRVMKDVLGDGLAVTLAGAVVGFIAALAAVRLLKSLLFGVTAYDPLTLAGAPVALVAVAIVACALPARRAARVDPMNALRAE